GGVRRIRCLCLGLALFHRTREHSLWVEFRMLINDFIRSCLSFLQGSESPFEFAPTESSLCLPFFFVAIPIGHLHVQRSMLTLLDIGGVVCILTIDGDCSITIQVV